MFDNYGKWLNKLQQLERESADSSNHDRSQVQGSSSFSVSYGASSPSNRSSSIDKSNSIDNNENDSNVKEVSIFKSSPTSGNGGYNVVDVALSRLINLDDSSSQDQESDYQPAADSESAGAAGSRQSYLDSSSSLVASSLDSSGLDFIRDRTREVTKYVSQFIRVQPVIADELFRIIEECKQNQNASACQMWSNLCVMTMYSYADAPTTQPDQHYQHIHDRQQLLSSSSSSTTLSAARKGLNSSWQHCKQFTIASICNTLRDWHRLERKSAGGDNALQSIYATIGDEPFSSPIGTTGGGGGLPAPGLVLRPNQPLQLLAYRYNFEGNLIGVDQFGPSEMEKFCLRSRRANNNPKSSGIGTGTGGSIRQQRRRRPPSAPLAANSGYFRFGKNMKLQSCQLGELEALQLLQEQQLNDTQFVDLYVAYPAGGSILIKPVPILLKNLLYNGNLINQKYSKDPSRWRLVHRFFYHSLIIQPNLSYSTTMRQSRKSRQSSSSSSASESASQPNEDEDQQQLNLLYARSVVLDLKFRKLDKGALLSSILLTIDYGIVSRSVGELAAIGSSANEPIQLNNNKSTTELIGDSFQLLETRLLVEQTLIDMQAYKRDLDLAITILSILSSIWSLIKCYNIQKCCGNTKLDLESLVRFVIIGCDTVALLLLAVLFTFITYLFVMLKFQHSSVQVLAPNEQLESSLLLNLQLAFVFKLIGLAHKLYVHLNADIFFIDWERPRMLTSSQILNLSYQQRLPVDEHSINKQDLNGKPLLSNQQQQQQQQVSFWRPYTVINRWFQMQTLRRLDLTVQLMLFVLIVHLTQASQLASADLSLEISTSTADTNQDKLAPSQSLVFRVLILAYIYASLAACQILYKKCLQEPWLKDPVREFVDLCSVANVSLFCWRYPRFGYYIHGRNANGSGDRGIGEMNALLEREERDLCSKRGLAPNSDQQTFILILPKVINDHYRNLLSREPSSFASKLSSAVASNQFLGRQMFVNQPLANQNVINNSGQQSGNNNLPRSALNLSSLSAASLSGTGSSGLLPHANGGSAALSGSRSQIDSLVAKHKSIQQFLTNFLEHMYKDIDYTIREGRRFENLLLLDFDFDDEPLVSLPEVVATNRNNSRSPIMQSSANPATQPILANQQQPVQQHQRHQAAATFCKDRQNSFTSLLWFGLEFDLALIELLSFLVLDMWLGQPALLITGSLLWLLHHAFRAIYISCSRYNLVTKALVDEKFLFNSN